MGADTGKGGSCHAFRHSLATEMLDNGADIRHVQALLGHSSPETTAQYLGLIKTDIKHAYDTAISTLLNPNQEANP